MKQLAIATTSRQNLEDLGYFEKQDRLHRKPMQTLQERMESALKDVASSQKAQNGSWTKQSPNEADEKCPVCDGMRCLRYDVPVGDPNFGKVYPCPECEAPRLQAASRRDMQQQVDDLILSAGIPKRHRHTFDDFYALPDAMRDGKELAAEYVIRFQLDKQITIDDVTKCGLVLMGPFGVGKTALATAALIAEAQQGGSILRVKFMDLLDDVKDAYGRQDVHSEDLIRAAQRVNFALLDDMGNPKINNEMTPDQIRITHKIMEWRDENMLPTLITTNCTRDQLKRQLTERTFERVRELCHFVDVGGDNLRL